MIARTRTVCAGSRKASSASVGKESLDKAARPILEINPRHERIVTLAKLGKDERAFKEDVAHLLYDEARVLDGDKPADAKMFSERLARLVARGLPGNEGA